MLCHISRRTKTYSRKLEEYSFTTFVVHTNTAHILIILLANAEIRVLHNKLLIVLFQIHFSMVREVCPVLAKPSNNKISIDVFHVPVKRPYFNQSTQNY